MKKAWLVVVACGLWSLLQLTFLAAVRVRETKVALGKEAVEWRAALAFSAYLAHEKVYNSGGMAAAGETVRAIAPGTTLARTVGCDLARLLRGAGAEETASRLAARALEGRLPPADQQAAMCVSDLLLELKDSGHREEELRLARRAIAEIEPQVLPLLPQRCVQVLSEHGEYAQAVAAFERVRPSIPDGRLFRETLLSVANAHRSLGRQDEALRFEAWARSAKSHPMLSGTWKPDSTSRTPGTWGPLLAAQISVDAPRPRWAAVLAADSTLFVQPLMLTAALVLLAWMPSPNDSGSAARALVGALVLAGQWLPVALIRIPADPTWGGVLWWAAVQDPFANARHVLFWSSQLQAVVFAVWLALPVIEKQPLRVLGWRASGVHGRYTALALTLALLFALHDVRHLLWKWTWLPRLMVGSVLMSLSAGFLEETLFRGYLLQSLQRFQDRSWLANLGQASLFMALHVPSRTAIFSVMASSQMVGTLLRWLFIGLLAGWLTGRSRCLWPAFVFHVALDLLVLYAHSMDWAYFW